MSIVVEALALRLKEKGWTCATAESCTGGMAGALITALPGSSAWYKGGVVAYANEIKMALLDVPSSVLAGHGAVSEACARAMALGACRRLGAQAALSITGVAGPDGGSADKPVGMVWLGWALCPSGMVPGQEQTWAECRIFPGDRDAVRRAAAEAALAGLLEKIGL